MSEIGSGIRSFVKRQLELRSRINNRSEPKLTIDQQLSLTNSTSVWIKMSSAVSIVGKSRAQQLGASGVDLAKDNVLFGGSLGQGTYQDYKVDTSAAQFGQRPKPGITDATIQYKNRFGTLRTAIVHFKCWTLDDLNKLEVLYMRPGYTVLLEFGKSLYANETSNGNVTYVNNPPYITDFFTKGYSKNGLYDEIDRRRVTSGGNYDALFGFIKNYTWSLQPDGSYNCTTEIITIGEIVESLKMTYGRYQNPVKSTQDQEAVNVAPANTKAQLERELELKYQRDNRTAVHTSLSKIVNYLYTNSLLYSVYNLSDDELIDIAGTIEGIDTDSLTRLRKVMYLKFEEGSPGTTEDNWSYGVHKHYIKIGLLNHIVNQQLLYINKNSPLMQIRTDMKNSKFLTTPGEEHISVNTSVCYIPTKGTRIGIPGSVSNVVGRISDINTAVANSGERIHTNEIYVEISYLKNLLDSILDRSPEGNNEVDVYTFYQLLIRDIKAATGSINDYELAHWDKDEFDIVDRNYVGRFSDRPKIDLLGLNSLVKGFSLQSKLSPKITTQIAISAQANSTAVNSDATALGALNVGLIDRIASKRQARPDSIGTQAAQDAENAQTAQAQAAADRVTELKEFFKTVRREISDGEIISYDFPTMETKYAEYLRNEISGTALADKTRHRAIIPFELSITLEGISGIRIAETFEIGTEVLPAVYKYNNGKSRVAFIVVGVDHTLSGREWSTNIRAQTINN